MKYKCPCIVKVVVAGLVRLLAGEDVGGFIGVIGR